jgi:peroxiredoxin
MKKIIFLLFIFLVFFPLAADAQGQLTAIKFSLYDMDDNLVQLSDFQGRPVILFFWTTWCPFCRQQIEKMNAFYPKLKESGIELLAINVEEDKEKIKNFISKHPILFRVLRDSDAGIAYAYGLLGVPTYVLIDSQAEIKFMKNYFPTDDYRRILFGAEKK